MQEFLKGGRLTMMDLWNRYEILQTLQTLVVCRQFQSHYKVCVKITHTIIRWYSKYHRQVPQFTWCSDGRLWAHTGGVQSGYRRYHKWVQSHQWPIGALHLQPGLICTVHEPSLILSTNWIGASNAILMINEKKRGIILRTLLVTIYWLCTSSPLK